MNFEVPNDSHENVIDRLVKNKETVGNQLKKIVGLNDVSASRANMLNLNRSMINMYLSVKRFNGENKLQNLTNFHTELKYCLNLLMNIKDIMDFIQELAHQRTIEAIDKDIRLYLHTYFNCEFTIILSLSNPFYIDSSTHIKG